ncbi:MAG: AraC family transcriptional regulator [Sphingobacteriia bacterium]|jgi:AraC-like DNA-binding protein
MNQFLVCFIAGASILLGFLLFFHPLQQNVKANKWLGLFVFTIGFAFIGSYLFITEITDSNNFLFKCTNTAQFLLAPSFLLSVLSFTNPNNKIEKLYWIHFVPFIIYAFAEHFWNYNKASISTYPIFTIDKDIPFLIRNLLPIIMLPYLVYAYVLLKRHQVNMKRIVSNMHQVNLDWLIKFLNIISIVLVIWLNDALFGLPYITEATNVIYAICVFFLAYYSIKQKTIFAFKQKDIDEIVDLFENDSITNATNELPKYQTVDKETVTIEKPKTKRLSESQMENLSIHLTALMETEKMYLDNDLNLPTIAEKLGIGIHEASFLINETAGDNFYNYINKFRVEEAKRLLASAKMEQLNILGIAFASGFNSKTTFNTTFKKIVGISPSQFSKEQKI